MRLFGCVAYAHVLDDSRKKLDNKREKCIFFIYSDESETYTIYISITKNDIINKAIPFIEKKAWDGILEKTVNVAASLEQEDKKELVAIYTKRN